MKSVRFHEATGEEIALALDWYDERSPDAGTRFLGAIGDAVERISEWPRAFPVVAHTDSGLEVRRVRLKTLPYSLVYVEREHELVVIAVAHLKRRTLYWVKRLGPG